MQGPDVHDLSRISLRWMVQQIAHVAGEYCIMFDADALMRKNIVISDHPEVGSPAVKSAHMSWVDWGSATKGHSIPQCMEEWRAAEVQLQRNLIEHQQTTFNAVIERTRDASSNPEPLTMLDKRDATGATTHDQLHIKHALAAPFWWLLELICVGHHHFDDEYKPRKTFR